MVSRPITNNISYFQHISARIINELMAEFTSQPAVLGINMDPTRPYCDDKASWVYV